MSDLTGYVCFEHIPANCVPPNYPELLLTKFHQGEKNVGYDYRS